jgi:cell division protein FtsZ
MDFIVENAIKTQDEKKFEAPDIGHANIKVLGVGGAGNNMVGWLFNKGVRGAEIIAANTDRQHLDVTDADAKFLLGKEVTRGLGCGGYPEKGAEAAQESIQEIKDYLKGADMAFICAGMGGGTGTGGAPVVAQVAKDAGAIVIGTVTMPFNIERERVEIKGIVETIAVPSLVNLDYADVKTIMTNGGVAAIGVGSSDTNNKVEEAVKGALSNPLLDINYEGATGALIHVIGGPDMTLDEISKVGELVTESLDDDANVIWGARISDEMKGKLTVMTIITGVNSPWILGKVDHGKPSVKAKQISDVLGIELVQ